MTSPDVSRLLDLFAAGDLVRPSAVTPSSVDLARALAVVAGAPSFATEPGVERIGALLGQPDHVIFVLADGLGMSFVERLPESAFLRRYLALELAAVFPSSTAPALTALATGVWPAAHAVPGWYTYLPKAGRTAVVLPFHDRASGKALTPTEVATGYVFPLVAQAAYFRRDYAAFMPAPVAASVYTRYVTARESAQPYTRLEAAVDAIAAGARSASSPSFTYLYYPYIDAAAHRDGVEAATVSREVMKLDEQLARLEAHVGDRARIAVSADHGLVTVPDSEKVILFDDDELRAMLRVWPPTGEPRVPCFHVRPGCRDGFRDAFRRRFGESFVLLSLDEAQDLALFGPSILAPESRARLGDFVAIPAGRQAMTYAGEPAVHAMKGMHGGLSQEEMRIPLVVC